MSFKLLSEVINAIDPQELLTGVAGAGGMWVFLRKVVLQTKTIASEEEAIEVGDKVREMMLEELNRLHQVVKDNDELKVKINELILENHRLVGEICQLKREMEFLRNRTCDVDKCSLRGDLRDHPSRTR